MTAHDAYWLGYRHGRRVAEHQPQENHEPRLRLEVHFAGTSEPFRARRAFALGELRGYRNNVLMAGETLHPLVRKRWEPQR